ncbi:IS1 family transposase, partial [Shigella flexneri]
KSLSFSKSVELHDKVIGHYLNIKHYHKLESLPVTHYGGAAGPVIFGVGYNDIKSWWLVGAVLTILTFLVHITLGVWWWNMLIGWNML